MTTNDDTLKLKDVSSQVQPELYTTSTGVVVRIRPVSRLLVTQVKTAIKDPKPPVLMIEEKGRPEPNPNDPFYVEALIDAQIRRTVAVIDLILALAVEVVSIDGRTIPYDSEGWAEAIAESGIEVPTEPKKRYGAWLKYIAIPIEEDLALILQKAQRQVFTLEADVEDSSNQFRSDETRNSDLGIPTSKAS